MTMISKGGHHIIILFVILSTHACCSSMSHIWQGSSDTMTQQSDDFVFNWPKGTVASSLQRWWKVCMCVLVQYIPLSHVKLLYFLSMTIVSPLFLTACHPATQGSGGGNIARYRHGNRTDDSGGLHLQGCLSECVRKSGRTTLPLC